MGRSEFHRLAERELYDAAQYYEHESPGLGASFLQEVERCLRLMDERPEAGSILQAGVRRRILRRFPYALLYRTTSTGVRILAVMNLKRRPTYWISRE